MNHSAISSYHNSSAKAANRNWKAEYAKRAIRQCDVVTYRPRVYTLCGASLNFEKEILADMLAEGIMPRIECFNANSKELIQAKREKKAMGTLIPHDVLKLRNKAVFTAQTIQGYAAFVDFDTCSWFYTVAKETLAICNRAHTVALTVMLSGQGNTPYAVMPDSELTMEKCTNPDAIAAWLERNLPGKSVVGIFLYRNNSPVKVATFIIASFAPKYTAREVITHESFNGKVSYKPRESKKLTAKTKIDGAAIRRAYYELGMPKQDIMRIFQVSAGSLGSYLAHGTGKLKK